MDKINEMRTNKEIQMIEIQNWRKNPTMLVTNMIRNPEKAKAENQYIAERKFKYHQQGGLTFSQIRENIASEYGGFNQDGRYFHNIKLHSPPRKISPSRASKKSNNS